ncbi:MAG: DUF2934 domain-containing protein [Deltaproteobacteria bacterium]|nr:DUF2934 domain-containing protein [Deltaproteobacteria bacterium]
MNQELKKSAEMNSSLESYPYESTIGNQSKRRSRTAPETVDSPMPARSAVAGTSLRERIAKKAYEIYERRGGQPGDEVADWLEAERLVQAETKAENQAPKNQSVRKRAPRRKKK